MAAWDMTHSDSMSPSSVGVETLETPVTFLRKAFELHESRLGSTVLQLIIIVQDFLLHLMEIFTHWRSLHGLAMFILFAALSKGSACEAPSAPLCFRRNEDENRYTCEWNSSESDVMFDLYSDDGEIKLSITKKYHTFPAESLIVGFPINIWVEAKTGNSTCRSPSWSGTLKYTVKYEVPQNISVSWSRNNLSLSWLAAETHPALVEVWFQRDGHPREKWENISTNTTYEASKYKVIIANLLEHSAYQVKIRHKSTKAKHPLWSNWSPVETVPAELELSPEVTQTIRLANGTREVKLTWKPASHAAAVKGVTYSINDTQSYHRCPCEQKTRDTNSNTYTIKVSHSAVNISVVARNAAGQFTLKTVQLPAAPMADLKICDKTLLDGKKIKKKTCLEWYELQDADLKPEKVMILTAKEQKKRKKIMQSMRDYIRYLYFEHRCEGGKPQTIKMCLFYKKEGVPIKEPQDFKVLGETHNSADLSWKAISYEHQQGFLTHYKLCREKIGSKEEPRECFNISASLAKQHLENLTPDAKYNISLAGVTHAGEGPLATVIINTSPEKPVNVWWSFGLLFVFFFFSTMCTVVLKRIKIKLCPPVPTPVIPDFISREADTEEKWEKEEEVHELTLHQCLPEEKSVPPEATPLKHDWDDETERDVEDDSEGSSDESVCPDSTDRALRKGELTQLEQLDTELAMLIYKNGLVFDVKTESP
ncbi:uncharacterized protein il12rb1 [Cololabis saira]|uniref:uncharacterized protein il12rb1 n=1 Tax=Cololabis saira TaxID=129043 RepID=UPI002AD2CD7C|nr:uncharacterized protein il12rb1 [Cololabis saira]